jgi:N-acetylmuramoyl-L-alanine amidase
MPLNKSQLNAKLSATQLGQDFDSKINETAGSLKENTFAKNATLLGNGPGSIHAGIESLESKIDNVGETSMGDAMCSFGDNVTGLSGIPDPSSIQLDLSVPTISVSSHSADPSEADSDGQLPVDAPTITAGATENQSVSSVVQQLTGLGAPVAKLETATLGASSLDAIDATASDVEGKSGALKSKIQAVASETKAASGTGGGASGGLSAITDTLKKAENMISDVIKEVSAVPSLNVNAPDLSNVTNEVSIGSIDDIKNNVNSIKASADDIAKEVTSGVNNPLDGLKKAQKDLEGFINKSPVKTGLGLLQDFTENITNDASSKIRAFTSNAQLDLSKISNIVTNSLDGTKEGLARATQTTIKNDTALSPKMKVVIGTIDDDKTNSEFVRELEVKAQAAGIPDEEINEVEARVFATEEELSKLDTTISGSLVTTADSFVTKEYDLSETLKRFDGEKTAFDSFTYIDSKEELGLQFKKINRPITEMIIHSSDTYTNQNIGCEELHIQHNQSGEDGIKYHLVIRRDGKLQRGRPLDKIGETNGANGHGENSIDICLIGGLNCSTGCPDPLTYRSSQSFTREQMSTLEAVCEAFYRRYFGGQVFGHNEIQPLVSDPHFQVSEYVETVFRKKSVYEDLANDKVMKPEELITKKAQ